MQTFELAVVFEHAVGQRLLSAQQFIVGWAELLGAALVEAELAARAHDRRILAVAHLNAGLLGPEVERRFAFWAEHCGGVPVALSDLPKRERANFQARLEQSEHRVRIERASELGSGFRQLLTLLNVSVQSREEPVAKLRFKIDLGQPGLATYVASDGELFVTSAQLLPMGDKLQLSLRLPSVAAPFDVEARVSRVKPALALRGGSPGGFSLALVSPPAALTDGLTKLAQAAAAAATAAAAKASTPKPPDRERRRAPRRPVEVPVKVRPEAPLVRLAYADEAAFRKDYVENLSSGGAFVRTQAPLPVDTAIELELSLHDGTTLKVPARVVVHLPQGMGVELNPDPSARQAMESAIAKIPTVVRRALVIENDRLMRRALTEALEARGFQVRLAEGGKDTLATVLAQATALEVVVTDLAMAELGSERLIESIRKSAARTAVIAYATGVGLDEALRLCTLGADEVIDRGAAPVQAAEYIEQAVNRRRAAERAAQAPPPPKPRAPKRPPSRPGLPVVKVDYATPEELKAVPALLAMGGLFAKGAPAMPLLTEVTVEITLPEREVLQVSATVVSVETAGLGLQLGRDLGAREQLDEAVGRYLSQADGSSLSLSLSSLSLSALSLSSLALRDSAMLLFTDPEPAAPKPAAPKTQAGPSLSAHELFGNYEIVSLFGRGGMAEVYYARGLTGPREGQSVAIKRLRPELASDPTAVEHFASEADLLRLFEHPNIVKTYEVGVEDSEYYLVMEAVDGRDLAQIIRRCKQRRIWLPIDFVCFVVKSMLDALAYAHAATTLSGQPLNVVHCDVSPSNLFISRTGEIKLGDFGLANVRPLPTASDVVRGKSSYLSPEALNGETAPHVDVWAANVVLYELLTLQRPFTGASHEAMFAQIRKGQFEPPRALRPEIPEALDEIVRRAFAPKLADRLADATELGAAIERFIDHRVATPLAIAAVVRGLFG